MVALLACGQSALGQKEPQPNIVLFLADDLGWGDLACYGHPLMKTPNLDAFAKQGVRFTQSYSASAVCSPSRSAILTGRTPYRNGVFTWIPEKQEIHLRKTEMALPKLLREAGYTTCHVGKWHLNSHFNQPTQPQPNDHGYDHWLATQNNAAPSHAFPTNFVRNGVLAGKADDYSAPFIVKEAASWLANKRDKNKPFFLAVWSHEPHYPIAAAEKFKALYPGLTDKVQLEHHGCVSQMDFAFGQLMKTLEDMKLAENTVVYFTSDNGPEGDGVTTPGRGSTGGLRGRKRAVYEGGIRVPGLLRWPGKVEAGGVCHIPVIGSDLFTTLCQVGGAKIPSDRVIDGGNLLPAVKGEKVERQRPLYWRCDIAPGQMKIAMRIDDWKIVANEALNRFELYNLATDEKETTDLALQETKEFARMKESLLRLNREIESEGPNWWKNYPPNGANKGKAQGKKKE
ncbi:MAG: N-acetylgalactosamine-6-sulfatase [Gemmataceae bacterium]|nr:N-acetylgalactosamine-6-sulfatase [Gemmataceae bacterium]